MHLKENKIGLENIVQSFTAKVKYFLLIAFQYNICLAKSCSVDFFPCIFFFSILKQFRKISECISQHTFDSISLSLSARIKNWSVSQLS